MCFDSFLTLHYAEDDLYVITGQKLFFEAHHVAKGEIKTIKIKPDWRTKHRFAVAPISGVKVVNGDNREFSAEYFEVSSGGDVNIEKTDGKLIASLAGEPLTAMNSKVFKDKENFTTKEILSYVTKGGTNILKKTLTLFIYIISPTGIQILLGGALLTLGGLNLGNDLIGGSVPGAEANVPAAPDVVDMLDNQAVREGLTPPKLCP